MINTSDHEPMHVHVKKGGELVIINLVDLSLRDVYMNAADVRRAWSIVAAHQALLVGEWMRIGPLP